MKIFFFVANPKTNEINSNTYTIKPRINGPGFNGQKSAEMVVSGWNFKRRA